MIHECDCCGESYEIICDECESTDLECRIVFLHPNDPDDYERETVYACRCGWRVPVEYFNCDSGYWMSYEK